ncbi:MAG: ATP-grasp domain-containing protein [Treponema sp.]|nr:ATP-grasp domain-containing protein [Treponema sp.]
MTDKYVLILGAGLMQRPAMEAAKELGYKTLVVDANPSAVCADFADRFEPVDLKDREKLADLALSLGSRLAAVFTAGTDFSASVSYVAEKCGLPAHSFEAALNASDKVRMRGCFKEHGVSSPEFSRISRRQIASYIDPGVLQTISFPKVVKPVDNMGARGCRLVRSGKEFLSAVEDAVRYSRSGTAILEDFMDGQEYSIDALVYGGTLTITGFADRHIYYPPYFIETGHTMPAAIPEQRKFELIRTFAQGVKALGLSCGAAKADIKYTANGPMIGEIAARLSGGYMSGWTYPYASGLNLTKQALLIALGRIPEELLQCRNPLPISDAPFSLFEVPCPSASAERAWVSIPGKVAGVYNIDNSSGCPFIRDVFVRTGNGSDVDFPRNNVEKCGNCITASQSRDLAVAAAERAVSRIVLRLEPDNRHTDAFLARREKRAEEHFPPDAYQFTPEQKEAFDALARSQPTVPRNEKTSSLLSEKVKNFADTIEDYNHRTLQDTLRLFDRLCPEHPQLEGRKFWRALARGGLQGILYVNDCASAEKNQLLHFSKKKKES